MNLAPGGRLIGESHLSSSKTTVMASIADEFTLESVKDFMVSRGGRVTNHQLVNQFKIYLTNPACKGKAL